jgi:hypothetical protein
MSDFKPLAVSVDDAARLLGCGASKQRKKKPKTKWRPGRSSVYEMIKRGELEAYKDGARTKVTMESIERRLASLPRIQPRSARVSAP